MRRSTAIATIVIIAIVLAIITLFVATRETATPAISPNPSPNATANPSASVSSSALASTTVLSYTDSGFSPASVTVAAGGQLTVKNTSSKPMQFNSDPHPVHTDDPELNLGPIAPGASATATLTKKGTFGVHNHLDPTQKATVTIK